MNYYVIAHGTTAAAQIARRIHDGGLPDIYRTPNAAMAAWQMQPAPMLKRYQPYAVNVLPCAVLTKRIEMQGHQLGEKP